MVQSETEKKGLQEITWKSLGELWDAGDVQSLDCSQLAMHLFVHSCLQKCHKNNTLLWEGRRKTKYSIAGKWVAGKSINGGGFTKEPITSLLK